MKNFIVLFVFILLVPGIVHAQNHQGTGSNISDPIIIDAPELLKLDFEKSTGGLPIVTGLETFRASDVTVPNQPKLFDTAADKEFVKACKSLLADHLFLQQQDYGILLDPGKRMKWNDPDKWTGDKELKKSSANFGKAMCFFTRKDGTMVGIGKIRWVTVSKDNGKTWTRPVQPESLISGMGKVWGQKISDGRYVLIYNPDLKRRWPLAMLTSEDGITFRNPRALNGEIPKLRYEGSNKDPGLSYHRGLSKWNNDGSWKDNDFWMVYSLNKEDICVIHVPASNL